MQNLQGQCVKGETNGRALLTEEDVKYIDIISIVGELNLHYNIEINVEDLLPENFNSMNAIYELVEKLQKGSV